MSAIATAPPPPAAECSWTREALYARVRSMPMGPELDACIEWIVVRDEPPGEELGEFVAQVRARQASVPAFSSAEVLALNLWHMMNDRAGECDEFLVKSFQQPQLRELGWHWAATYRAGQDYIRGDTLPHAIARAVLLSFLEV